MSHDRREQAKSPEQTKCHLEPKHKKARFVVLFFFLVMGIKGGDPIKKEKIPNVAITIRT